MLFSSQKRSPYEPPFGCFLSLKRGVYLKDERPLSVSYDTLARFFEAAGGNHRNAFYMYCDVCKYCREEGCGTYLFIPGYDCIPVLLPCADAEAFLKCPIDKTDCLGIIRTSQFVRLYQRYIELHTTSEEDCPIQQLLCLFNRRKDIHRSSLPQNWK